MKPSISVGRRDFLRTAGLTSMGLFLGDLTSSSLAFTAAPLPGFGKFSLVNFTGDGLMYTPEEYLETLLTMNQQQTIEADYYSMGGTTAALEASFAELTGKEKAVFLPTGTLANEVTIRLLAGDKTKVVVPENSHIYRDEADAAQVVHNKRLVPCGKGKPYFDVNDLDRVITYHKQGEVFTSEVGAVSIECPVRRADGTAVPLETIRDISSYCRENGYPLHLDGARLHLASAWTGIPIAEYASHFDTVYISQYKYLNAAFGAVLCGPATLIDRMPMEAKRHGAAVFQTWVATAMALHHLNTIEEDLKKTRAVAEDLIHQMNALEGVTIVSVPEGTNVFTIALDPEIDPEQLAARLLEHHNILVRLNKQGAPSVLKMNASLLRRPVSEIVGAWEKVLFEM